ncbi:MAG TPA: hypothetical protein VNE62_12985 [Actinomycetota bacterium]|nr:hypothetical protein [Actinomycetota bacterium]
MFDPVPTPNASPVPSASDLPEESPSAAPAGPSGFVITLVDQHGRHPRSIPALAEGPTRQALSSDAQGRLVVRGPAGDYDVRVQAGCFDTLVVTYGESGRGRIVDGQTVAGSLDVEWKHRYAPGGPVFSSLGPNWPVGRVVELQFQVQDDCDKDVRAPDKDISTFRFLPGPNLRVDGQPSLRADSRGFSTIRVVCTAEGEAELTAVDSDNPDDKVELVSQDLTFPERPRCAKEGS